jgi:peptidoglycan/LPS O-acetylase OafA/YrhL
MQIRTDIVLFETDWLSAISAEAMQRRPVMFRMSDALRLPCKILSFPSYITTMDAIANTNVDRDTGEVLAHTKYRADIDGLRAVAVLAVLAYHVGFWWIPGGYVGVDIFFVISGYLISAIIQKEVGSERFSLAGFYARRICRILPAFVAMALVTSVFAYHYFFPSDLLSYSRSLMAAALSVANFYFWSLAGYFDVASLTQPLVHTWSLAVEEQFYIFLPLFLILAHKKFPAYRQTGILLILVLSLGFSSYLVFTHPSATFYLIPTRAWELLVGKVLSFPRLSVPIRRAPREALSAVGAGLIAFAVFGLSATTPFPGAAALLPCIGTALIISAGQAGQTVVGNFLSLRPFVFIGAISYSLYLWHWPIIVFQHEYAFLVPNQSLSHSGHMFLLRNIAIIVTSFVMAILSWRFVEQPFRRGYSTRAKSRILIYGAASVMLLTSIGGVLLVKKGFPNRFPPEAVRFASYLDYGQEHFRVGQCFILEPGLAANYDKATCLAEHPGKKAYLLVGDSTAADLWYGLSQKISDADILQATGAGCKPLFEQSFNAYAECSKVIDYALNNFLTTHTVDAVIISARWPTGDLPRLAHTITVLKQRGIRVVVIGPRMAYTSALPHLLALSVERRDPGLPDRELVPRPESLDPEVAQVAATSGAPYLSMYDVFCPQGVCLKVLPAGVPLQFDDIHFTREGSLVAAEKIVASHILDSDSSRR